MPNSNKSELILTYQKLITSKKISIDIAQKEILRRLDLLSQQMVKFVENKRGVFRRMILIKSIRNRRPEGVYMYGDVGRGKSFLMDLFYKNLPKNIRAKRYHFHAFMQEMHKKINEARDSGENNVVEYIAKKVSSNVDLICFDEMQVNDIADAMIIGRLFEGLFLHGTAMVVTSNRHPDDLYKDGLQRERFLPFIEMFKNNMEVIELSGIKDYRLEHIKSLDKTYYYPLDKSSKSFVKISYKNLTGSSAANEKLKIRVKGRKIKVPKSHMGVALFSFKDLCEVPLGAEDYLEIARQFNTIIISDIPKMTEEDSNKAIRFIHLVDALYEQKTKLVCSAEVEPQGLYKDGDRSFEFERTVSRLIEMQSEKYLSEGHKA